MHDDNIEVEVAWNICLENSTILVAFPSTCFVHQTTTRTNTIRNLSQSLILGFFIESSTRSCLTSGFGGLTSGRSRDDDIP